MSNLSQAQIWGFASFALSLLLIVLLIVMWSIGDVYIPQKEHQLTGKRIEKKCKVSPLQCDDVQVWLDENWFSLPSTVTRDKTIQVPTGLFIQSLQFVSANEVNVTGHIWQKFSKKAILGIGQFEQDPATYITDTTNAEKKNLIEKWKKHVEKGFFVFPEEVNSGPGRFRLEEAKTIKLDSGVEMLYIWHFNVTLLQHFSYEKYPFDHKTVWIKIWPKAFDEDAILTPDLVSYRDTSKEAIYGYDRDIVLGNWTMENTFFDYDCSSYSTTFGASSYQDFMKEKGQKLYDYLKENPDSCWKVTDLNDKGVIEDDLQLYPTLRYNIVIKRQFQSAFIVHFIPLGVVAVLLFALLMMITNDPEKSSTFGLSTSGVIASCSGLFFTVMLAHIQLKQEFVGVIVYMENFYFMMYIAILVIAVNSYLFAIGTKYHFGHWSLEDNLLLKVAYWPLILGFMVIITWYYLFIL